MNQLVGEQEAERYQEIVPADKSITWEVYYPDNDSAEVPGVIVYVSPQNSGRIDSRWRRVLDQQNLIYIGANGSGNRIPVSRRMVLALMSLKALEQQHLFSGNRIYVTGFSNGGRVASILASQYPEVFTGAIYICGVDFWNEAQTPRVERVVQNRFVFLTGSKDFNRNETGRVYHSYLKAGAQHSKLMVVPGMTHALADAKALAEALEFLESGDLPVNSPAE